VLSFMLRMNDRPAWRTGLRPARHPVHPPRPQPGRLALEVLGPARPACHSLTLGGTPVATAAGPSDRVGRFAAPAAPGKLAQRPRRCAPECTRAAAGAPVSAHRDPPTSPRPLV